MPNQSAPYDAAQAVTSTAEATKAVAEQAGGLGRYLADVLGTLPHDLVGKFGDRVAHARARQAAKLYSGTKKILEDAGYDISKLSFPTASIEVPLLEAATMEDRDGLSQLWEKLLAAAIAPDTRSRVRVRHIEILKALEPLDALILQRFDDLVKAASELRAERFKRENIRIGGEIGHTELGAALQLTGNFDKDDVAISFEALDRLGLVKSDTLGGTHKTALARAFLSVVDSVKSK